MPTDELGMVTELAKQLPYVALMFGMVMYFLREIRHINEQHSLELKAVRDEYFAERKQARDDYSKIMSEYRTTITEAIQIIRDLQNAITQLSAKSK